MSLECLQIAAEDWERVKAERDRALRERDEKAERDLTEIQHLSRERDAAEARVERLEKIVRWLLGDLSDAERAISGWKFKGGMGANIAQEDKGRFPTIASNAHRFDAEEALSPETQDK